MNHLVGEEDPAILRNDLHEILLDLCRFSVLGQVEALSDALHVGVDDNAGGGIFVFGAGADATLVGDWIDSNTAGPSGPGGGIYATGEAGAVG